MSHSDCAGALFYAIMKPASAIPSLIMVNASKFEASFD